MSSSKFCCYSCRAEIEVIDGRVGRSDSCEHCRNDLHVCYNCAHFDTTAYNECREPMAERVVDKDKRNFCDYFTPGGHSTGNAQGDKESALKKLNDLFK